MLVLLNAKHHFIDFMYINSFNPAENPMNYVLYTILVLQGNGDKVYEVSNNS